MKIYSNDTIGDIAFAKAIKKPIAIACIQINEPFKVQSREGWLTGKKGDWLLRGVEGELYICDATIFSKTYDIQ